MEIHFVGKEGLFEDSEVVQSTIEEAYEFLKDQTEVSIDIETTRKFNGKYGKGEGLSPYLSKIVMFQIGTLDKQFIIDTRYYSIDKLLPILSDKKIVKVGHNIKFEYVHILHNYGVRLENVYDTQINEEIIYCGIKKIEFSLKALIERYFDVKVNKATRLEFLKIQDRPFSFEQLKYGAEDIIYPLKIKALQKAKIDSEKLNNVSDLENKFVLVLGDIEYKGMNLNKEKWIEIYNKNKPLVNQSKITLNDFIIKYYRDSRFVSNQLDLFNTESVCNISWSSPKQVIDFFKYIDACPQEVSKQTKKLEYTVNAKLLQSSLHTINKTKPDYIKQFIKAYCIYKEYEQRCTTFGIDFFKYINPVSGRVHSNFKQVLNTGRISSTNPNLQNIPSDEVYRKAFDALDGYDIVNADYGGQETVVLANVSEESNISRLIIEGGDMH